MIQFIIQSLIFLPPPLLPVKWKKKKKEKKGEKKGLGRLHIIFLVQEAEETFSHGEILMIPLNLSSTVSTAQLVKQNFTKTIL